MKRVKGYCPVGLIGAGKDTFFEIARETYPQLGRGAFADELKEMAQSLGLLFLSSFVEALRDKGFFIGPEQEFEFVEICTRILRERDKRYLREVYQHLGTREVRERFGEDSWVRALFAAKAPEENPLTVTDGRFHNEVDALQAIAYQPAFLDVDFDVLVKRYKEKYLPSTASIGEATAEYSSKLKHRSEALARELAGKGSEGPYPVIPNSGTKEEFCKAIKSFLEQYPLEG